MWALPNRQVDYYGLHLEKAQSLRQLYQPTLLICLDCGTNSHEAIGWLKQQGVDVLVADHHPMEDENNPALALVNPKAHGQDTNALCAAGLALVLCHALTQAWNAGTKWDRDTAILLAGIGTLADSVRLNPVNRAITKTAIALMNDASKVAQIPGLAALFANGPSKLNQRQLQFDLIPALNAPGRLGSAEPVVTLLTTTDSNQARSIARHCREQNERRKEIQREMVRQATALAEAVVNSHPDAAVLVLAGCNWHHGVAGPAASQIAETYQHSVILVAPHGEQVWKGSGRSANGDHLGHWIRAAKALGLVERGGGHAAAVGLAITSAQLVALQTAGLCLPMPTADREALQEVIGQIDQLQSEEWATVTELLAPFGQCNPFPVLWAPGASLQGEPVTMQLKTNGQPWAIRAEFKMDSGRRFNALWRNVNAATTQWAPGARCDLALELSTQARAGKTYYNWSVVSFQSREATVLNHRDELAAGDGFQPPAQPPQL
jgi:single-stranded-DNA-specific exonuclease